jgi:hypothetical protein
LKFYADCHNATYVITPATRIIDPQTLHQMPVRGLRAKFFRHVFDSVDAARELGWTEEERKRVEEGLLGHKDFGRKVYLAGDMDQKIASSPSSVPTARCVVFLPEPDGGSTQCESPALVGSNFCRTHVETVEAAV